MSEEIIQIIVEFHLLASQMFVTAVISRFQRLRSLLR